MGLLITLDLSTSSFPTFSLPPLARGFTHLSRSFSSGFPRGFRVCFRWSGHLGRERSMFHVKRLFALLLGIRLIGSRPPYGRLRARPSRVRSYHAMGRSSFALLDRRARPYDLRMILFLSCWRSSQMRRSSFILFSTTLRLFRTVEWSRPPNSAPMAGVVISHRLFAR